MNEDMPRDVLVVRALSFLDLAQLQLSAEKLDSAADSMEKAAELLRKVLG